jgi:glycosyltransferase involved in cell wall biosynthesis
MTLWVVSPMLNDAPSFLRVREEVTASCVAAGLHDRIRYVVVDDSAGSDREVDQLRDLDDVEVLTPPFNLGHQRAIVFGLRRIAAAVEADDIVITMDSDGEDQPSDVPRLVGAMADRTALVVAERTERSESLSFRLMYVCFRVAFRLLTGTAVRSGNFAAQRGHSLVTTIGHPSFDLCYSSTLLTLRRPMAKVPCARGTRFAGESRMNRHSLIAHGIRMMLPFSERIAVRMLVASGASFVALATTIVLVLTGALGDAAGAGVVSVVIAIGAVMVVTLVSFVVLFAGFAQSSPRTP